MNLYLLGIAERRSGTAIISLPGAFTPKEIPIAVRMMATDQGCELIFGCTRQVTPEQAAPLLGRIAGQDFVHTVFDARGFRS